MLLEDKTMKDFGELVREARTEKGMSVRALQAAIRAKNHGNSISIGLLGMIETGNRSVTYEMSFLLSKVLSIDLETALSEAHKSRLDYCVRRERASLEDFLVRHKLTKDVDLSRLTR